MTDYFVQWRAYVGPPYKGQSEDGFWNWANEIVWLSGVGSGKDPADEPDTTLASTISSAAATSAVCTDTSSLPSEGGVWIGPGSGSETWEYCLYTANSSNTLTIIRDNDAGGEFPGTHQSGAEVKFWWELNTASGEPIISEEMTNNMSVVTARLTLEGVVAPAAALRIGHGVLFQSRKVDSSVGSIGSAVWQNEFYGWITGVRVRDDVNKFRSWTVEVGLVDTMAGMVDADSIQVGNTTKVKSTTVQVSSTLAKPYKAFGEDEFVAATATTSGSNVVDGNRETLWISEKYTGKANTYANPGTTAGVRSTVPIIITQAHLAPYPGQPNGYRWIELTVIDDVPAITTYTDILVYSKRNSTGDNDYSVDYAISFDNGLLDQSWTAGDRIIICEDTNLFAEENPNSSDATIVSVLDTDLHLGSGNSYTYVKGIAEVYKIDKASGTGFWRITIGGTYETGDLDYDSTAEAASDALNTIGVGNTPITTSWGGPLPTSIYIAIHKDLSANLYGTDATLTITNDDDANVSISLVVAATGQVNQTGNWFDEIDLNQGSLTLKQGGASAYENTQQSLRWGTMTWPPAAGDEDIAGTHLWTGDPLAAIEPGQTIRLLYSPGGSPTASDDYYDETRREIHTPGYEPVSSATDTSGWTGEWVLIEVPGTELELQADITAGSSSLTVGNAGGATGSGLPSAGTTTIQIGSEQITYTTGLDRDTGVISSATRGANATAHVDGDPVYVVTGGVASDAQLVSSVRLWRKAGQPTWETYKYYTSPYLSVRTPSDTSGAATYQDDYPTVIHLVESGNVFKWTQSTADTDEYYLELYGGGNPKVTQPTSVTANGVALTENSGALGLGEWDYDDRDTLGYSTIYIRLADDTDPDTKTDGYVTAQFDGIQIDAASWTTDGDWEYHDVNCPGRIKWILFQVTRSEDYATRPDRVMLNEVEINLDTSVFAAGEILVDKDAVEVIQSILTTDGDLPAAAIGTDLSGANVSGFTTESGSLWPIIADMAEFTNTRITLDRCSNVDLKPDPFWSISGTPSETAEFDRSSLVYFEPGFVSGRQIGQIELKWRDVDNSNSGNEYYPATKDSLGRVVTVGPYIYADATAAQAGAQKRYFQMRRPFDAAVEILAYGRNYRPGDVYGISWQIDDTMLAMDRTYMITSAEHRITNGTWVTALTLMQISRTDEK